MGLKGAGKRGVLGTSRRGVCAGKSCRTCLSELLRENCERVNEGDSVGVAYLLLI